jgi:hypothetical protein
MRKDSPLFRVGQETESDLGGTGDPINPLSSCYRPPK